MDTSNLVNQLKSIHSHLENEVRILISLLESSSLEQATVFELPRTLKHEEEQIQTYIPVTSYQANEGLSRAFDFYRNFYLENPIYSSKSIGRLPGVICIQSHKPAELIQQLELINHLKHEFHEIAQLFKNTYHRHQVLHDGHNFPGLILTYVTRKISYYEGAVDSISFSWVNKSNHSKITRDEAIEKLRRSQTQLPQGQLYDDVSWFDRVEREISLIQSLPQSKELRIYRALKLKVITNLLLTKEYDEQLLKDRKIQKEGNLPLILINPGQCKVHNLKDYDVKKITKPGRVKSEPKLISKLISLYTPTN